MSTHLDDPVAATPSLPQAFDYDAEAKTLTVDFADGSIVKYFPLDPAFLDPRFGFSNLDPRLAFLDPLNPGRNRDFLTWADQRMHTLYCPQRGSGLCTCACQRIVKSKVIQEATNQLSEPDTRPLLVSQQSGRHT